MNSPPTVVRLAAPAKLNLGLAIVGRRLDGFHDLVTIFQAIDLCDTIEVRYRPTGDHPAVVRLGAVNAVPGDTIDPVLTSADNLAVRAARAAADALDLSGELIISIDKRIPSASGMGGSSSDAATTIAGVERIAGRSIPEPERGTIELALGSDVPFFRRGGTALAGGRGEDLVPLPAPADVTFIVVTPHLDRPIPRKTATLFGALGHADFDDGGAVRTQAHRLREGRPLDPDLLGNGFERALVEVAPEIGAFRDHLNRVREGAWGLSGAGPTHFLPGDDPERSQADALRLAESFGGRFRVSVCAATRPWTGPGECYYS